MPSKTFLPTGITALDHLISGEGIPRGAFSLLFGQSTLRTFLALRVLQATAQKGGNAFWIDWKGEMDFPTLEKLDLVDSTNILRPSSWLDSCDCVQAAFETGFDLIVLNGVDVIPPRSENEIATSAAFWVKILPRIRQNGWWSPNTAVLALSSQPHWDHLPTTLKYQAELIIELENRYATVRKSRISQSGETAALNLAD
jgi:hypothetical protein